MLWWLLPLALGAEPVLPSLVQDAPPVYPAEALEQGLSASVVLELVVDSEGRVVEAGVAESAGPGFDEAALDAARSFVFTPARDARGQAVPATILYRVNFDPQAAARVSVRGRLREAGTRVALDDATITLRRPDGLERVVDTDTDGSFALSGVPAGAWTLTATGPGLTPQSTTLEVQEGKVVEVELSLVRSRPWEADEPVSESIVVIGQKVTPEVTERVLDAEEIRYLPGTNGDVVRVVQNLPGVARPPLNIGQLLIRGTAPEDSAYYLDGARIPEVFHFAGFSTVLNSDIIEQVAFLPGNYGARYGRTLGGVVDIRTLAQLPERSRGYLSVDVFQTTAFVEQLVGSRTSLQVSGRRSYVDAILNPIFNSTGGSTLRAPRYYDLQARALHETGGGSLDVLLVASDDRFAVVGADNAEDEVDLGLTTWFQKLRVQSREALGNGWQNELSVLAGPENRSFLIAPDGEAYERRFTVALRNEVRRPVTENGRVGFRAGVDAIGAQFDYLYDVGNFGPSERGTYTEITPAAYGESTVRLGSVELTPGLRVDAAQLGEWTGAAVDPRFASRLLLGPTILKASIGRYSQFPITRQVAEAPQLGPQSAVQASLGIDQQISETVSVELTGFGNRLSSLVVGREDAFRFFTGPPPTGPLDTGPYANDGTGRIYGAETLLRLSSDRTTGWLSATFSRSLRSDREGREALFTYDQPFVLTALGSHQLPKRWRLGARARASSGNPYTPVVNRAFDLDSREYQPVYGKRDSARLPTFWSVDVRADKDWVFDNWTLTAYLDLQNAANTQNVEVQSYSFDYAEEDPITGLPVLPAFGVRGEW